MSEQRAPIIGIDLGTTNSLVAVVERGVPRLLLNALGETLTPSAVSIAEDGHVLVGAAAKARAATHPARTAVAFKRDMGTDRTVELAGRTFTPVELSALVLGELKREAEVALGRPVEEAVITVPAYFGDLQRQATRQAGELAGLKVERIINEPTAAALAYGLHARNVEQRIAVLDLGGGTFDVTILEIVEGVIEIQASSGDARLGGEDFDDALLADLAGRLERAHGVSPLADPLARARLKAAAVRARHQLSTLEQADVGLPALRVGTKVIGVAELVRRGAVEALWSELLARMRKPILLALQDAGLQPSRIDSVLLVGGATRMPCVVALARDLFGKPPLQSLPPDEAIAIGAAVQGALKSRDAAVEDLVVTDVAPFSLGVSTVTRKGREYESGVFTPILERGTTIPASRVQRLFTVADFQKELRVQVFQGEHIRCEQNQKLGEYVFSGLPAAPSGQPVDVRFSYDLNGILEVDLELPGSGRRESFVIESRPGALSPQALADARARLAGLKLHPRDALPNTVALARAEELFQELIGPRRAELADAIHAFRSILEDQRPAEITELRERLIAFMQSLR